jgi:hypothetical protein
MPQALVPFCIQVPRAVPLLIFDIFKPDLISPAGHTICAEADNIGKSDSESYTHCGALDRFNTPLTRHAPRPDDALIFPCPR